MSTTRSQTWRQWSKAQPPSTDYADCGVSAMTVRRGVGGGARSSGMSPVSRRRYCCIDGLIVASSSLRVLIGSGTADVDLAQLLHHRLGQRAGEHEQRPGEAGAIQLPQLPRPQRQRADPPRGRRPPARSVPAAGSSSSTSSSAATAAASARASRSTPFCFSIRVSWSGVKIDGMKKANRPRRSTS